MRFDRLLPALLLTACSSGTSVSGQLITCDTDPDTGVIVRCAPGAGDGDAAECKDIDEDGNGEPGDGPILRSTPSGSSDDDDDGVPNAEDCDEHPGEDNCDDQEVDLPYDVKMKRDETYRPIIDAFDEKGGQPAAILSVTMDGGGTWRLAELRAGTAFTVTTADCNHAGNRDTGRDRVIITWRNPDGSRDSDHLDLRYCDD